MLDTTWLRIAGTVDELPFGENRLCEVETAGRKFCLGRHQETIFAFAATCPHAGASFAQGTIDPLGNVVCPKHRYKFTMRNGYNCSGEGFKLKTYPVAIKADGIYIGVD
jgi:3-phenylpropionate/trans-cinnamate dioxygenase ferredoxin subunit